ncbi:hypothetical protein KCP70_07370 [Salmonella enterica subsp. enterica]|nr:hypothetical protein KCP70_07370 [Salmonella enterica subsp. enterica]
MLDSRGVWRSAWRTERGSTGMASVSSPMRQEDEHCSCCTTIRCRQGCSWLDQHSAYAGGG